jgi:uncharacterized protein
VTFPADLGCEVIDPFLVLNRPDAPQVPMAEESLRDDESLERWPSSDIVGHLFRKDDAVKQRYVESETVAGLVANMDAVGISRGGVAVAPDAPRPIFDEIAGQDGRLFIALRNNPHEGMRGIRRMVELCESYPVIRAISITPFQIYPFIHANSKELYPVYAKCVELDIPVYMNMGFPGPRVPAWTQDPTHVDEVCWFFPDLKVVLRHGGMPWVDICVQMLLRWPNLYYATTAMAPRFYPPQIVDLVNRRGTDKIIFAGYWPLLSHERVFAEIEALGIRPEALPAFLGGNAARAFGLAQWNA